MTHLKWCIVQPYLISVACSEVLGCDLGSFIVKEIFEPLDITQYELGYSPEGYFYGASKMKLSVHDLIESMEKNILGIENNQNYIQWIRRKVGHDKVMMVFAGGCIFNENGEVLLQRRGDSNLWGFPGGAIELGETPEMAAIREVKEETGLDVEVVRMMGIYTDTDLEYPNGDKAQSICIAYELKAVDGQLRCDTKETAELKYFSLDEEVTLFCKQHEEMMNDLKKKFNLIRLVNILKRRPGIYFGTAKIESLCAVGRFIQGYLTSGAATGQRDEFDTYFYSYFSGFVREQLDVELDHYEFWPETIEKNTADMDAAVEKFFELFDAFCEEYKANRYRQARQ